MLAWVSGVLWWVLGSLVLPTVSPLVLGVFAGEGVVAFGLGVGGGAGVGVAVTGPGFGRGWLGVAGRGRSPLLAEGLVALPLCPSGGSGGPAAPPAGVAGFLFIGFSCVVCACGAGSARALVRGVRLWGPCRWWLWRCVLCSRVGLCAVCRSCVWVPVLAFLAWFGGSVWVWGLRVVASLPPRMRGLGAVPRLPLLGSVGGGVSPCCPLCVPSPLFLFAASLGAVFPWCLFPAVVVGGGSLTLARVPSPGVSPRGGRCLHSSSGCNSVVRAVHLYPLGTNGPAP